jgi:hypothetical protein
MTQTLLSKNVTIRDLIDQFGLQLVRDRQFFTEWRENLPELTEQKKQTLDVIREDFGLITNRESFVFLKLVYGSPPKYAMSGQFSLLNAGDIYQVLQIMKRLGQL